jgi:hypothetical protein
MSKVTINIENSQRWLMQASCFSKEALYFQRLFGHPV